MSQNNQLKKLKLEIERYEAAASAARERLAVILEKEAAYSIVAHDMQIDQFAVTLIGYTTRIIELYTEIKELESND